LNLFKGLKTGFRKSTFGYGILGVFGVFEGVNKTFYVGILFYLVDLFISYLKIFLDRNLDVI